MIGVFSVCLKGIYQHIIRRKLWLRGGSHLPMSIPKKSAIINTTKTWVTEYQLTMFH